MNYSDAVEEILKKAGQIKLAGENSDIVTRARREFAKKKRRNSEFIEPIEQIVKECIHCWTVEQKRGIWESTETGAQSKKGFATFTSDAIDNDLEGELNYQFIETLSPSTRPL
jgi:hypothetical protein